MLDSQITNLIHFVLDDKQLYISFTWSENEIESECHMPRAHKQLAEPVIYLNVLIIAIMWVESMIKVAN